MLLEERNKEEALAPIRKPKIGESIQSAYRLTEREYKKLEEENRSLSERKNWLSSSYMIGDKLLDCTAGAEFGVKSILLGTGYGKEELERAKKEGKQDFSYFPTLLDAVKAIL